MEQEPDHRGTPMARAFRGMGAVIPPRTPAQLQRDRRDVRLLVPVLLAVAVVAAVVTFALTWSVLITALAVVVAYVVVVPVTLAALLRRER